MPKFPPTYLSASIARVRATVIIILKTILLSITKIKPIKFIISSINTHTKEIITLVIILNTIRIIIRI